MDWPTSLYQLPRQLLGTHVWNVRDRRPSRAELAERIARLEIESWGRQLANQYAYCYDAGDLEGMMEIYSDDCVLVNRHGTFIGVDAIRDNYRQAIGGRTTSFHHVNNVQVRPSSDGSEAWVTAYIHCLTVKEGQPGGSVATCVFRIRRYGDVWRISDARMAVSGQHTFGAVPTRPRSGSAVTPTKPETVHALLDLG